jgi:hypothetical protein
VVNHKSNRRGARLEKNSQRVDSPLVPILQPHPVMCLSLELPSTEADAHVTLAQRKKFCRRTSFNALTQTVILALALIRFRLDVKYSRYHKTMAQKGADKARV